GRDETRGQFTETGGTIRKNPDAAHLHRLRIGERGRKFSRQALVEKLPRVVVETAERGQAAEATRAPRGFAAVEQHGVASGARGAERSRDSRRAAADHGDVRAAVHRVE